MEVCKQRLKIFCVIFHFFRRDINHLYQLLAYARKIFHQIDTINPVNPEAGKL